jgi:hypothetical protein
VNRTLPPVAQAVRHTAGVLFAAGQVVELRVLNYPKGNATTSGYFDNPDALAHAAATFNGKVSVYLTLNPVNPALLARSCNRVKEWAKTTTGDADIVRRTWLLLDFDSVRPTGISATEVEHAAALDRAGRCRDWLTSQGWPAPVEADSGNGGHLVYRIDLANNAGAAVLVQDCLDALDLLFSDAAVSLDTTVGSAGQLTKCYGTVAVKGDHTADRPHRTARILSVPKKPGVVPVGLLEALAARKPPSPEKAKHKGNGQAPKGFDVEGFLAEHGLEVASEGPWKDGGYKWVLAVCPWNAEHTNRSACVGRHPSGAVWAGCHHKSCQGRKWQDLREMLDPGCYDKKSGAGPVAAEGKADRPETVPATPKKRPRPRTLEPYQPFPAASLPEPMGKYVREAAAAVGCDAAFVALPALAAVASVIGNTRTIQLKRGWVEPSVIWSVIVGDSGTLKTPAYLKAVGHLFRIQKQFKAENEKAWRRYREELHDYRASKRKGDGGGEPPPEPLYKRVVISDITIQKVAEVLEDNPRGVLVARDELAGWLGSFRQYKGQSEGSDLPNWLEMFRAGPLIVDRKTGDRRHYFVERAAVSITGSIQPRTLARAFSAEFLEAGGGARILLAMPPKRPKRWSDLDVDEDTEKKYFGLLDKLRALDFVRDATGHNVPLALVLRPDAQTEWVQFVNDWGDELSAVEGELAAAYSKLEAYAARLALLHHVVTHVGLETDDSRQVGVRSVKAGTTLCRWFAAEARRLYSTLTESEVQRDGRRLVEFIAGRGGAITARQLQRSNDRKYPTSGDAEDALDALVSANLAVWEETPETPQGGQCARFCRLRPTPDSCSETDPGEAPKRGSEALDSGGAARQLLNIPREKGASVGCQALESVRSADDGTSVGRDEQVSGNGGPSTVGEGEDLSTPFDGDSREREPGEEG